MKVRMFLLLAGFLFFGGATVGAQVAAPLSKAEISSEREAERLLIRGRFDEADAVIARGLAASPDDIQLHMLAARVRVMRTSELGPLVADWRARAAREPRNPTPPIVLVRLNEEGFLNNPREAERLALRAVELAPDSAWAHYALALTLVGADGRADDLLDAFRLANTLDPRNAIIARRYADELRRRKNFERAVAVLRVALMANPSDGGLQTAIWENRLEQSPDARAAVEAEARAVLDANPDDADLRNQIGGFIRETLRDEAWARRLFDEVHRIAPDFGRGNRRVIFSSPENAIFRQYCFAGQRYDQLVAFNKLQKTESPDERLAAMAEFIRMLPKDDSYAEYYVAGLYRAALKAGNLSRAESVAETLTSFDARYAALFGELAGQRLKNGETARAVELARRAEVGTRTFVPIVPPTLFDMLTEPAQLAFWKSTRGNLFATLGEATLRAGEFRAAATAFREAVAIRPTSATCFRYGQALEGAGEVRAAAETYADVVAFNDAEAKEAGIRLDALAARAGIAPKTLLTAATTRKRERLRQKVRELLVDEPMPSFSVRGLDGKRTVSLAALRGKIVLVNFWSVTCMACRVEFPALAELEKKYGPRGFVVVSLSTDADPAVALRFQSVNRLPSVAYAGRDVALTLNVNSLPANFIIDRNGRMRFRATGFGPGQEDNFRAIIEELFDEPETGNKP